MTEADPQSTPVTQALDRAGVPYRFFRHPGQVYSLEQAANERGQRPEQIIRSIVFRLSADQFLMVLIAGPEQISWPRLREHMGTTRMSMASEEEVLRVTGFPRGAVSPLGLPREIRILADENILAEEEVSVGSGVRNTTIIIRRDDLLRALGEIEIGHFSEGTRTD